MTDSLLSDLLFPGALVVATAVFTAVLSWASKRLTRKRLLEGELSRDLAMYESMPEGKEKERLARRIRARFRMLERKGVARSRLAKRRVQYLSLLTVLSGYWLIFLIIVAVVNIVEGAPTSTNAAASEPVVWIIFNIVIALVIGGAPLFASLYLSWYSRALRLNPWHAWSVMKKRRLARWDKQAGAVNGVVAPGIMRMRIARARSYDATTLPQFWATRVRAAWRFLRRQHRPNPWTSEQVTSPPAANWLG